MRMMTPLRRSLVLGLLTAVLVPSAAGLSASRQIASEDLLKDIFGKWLITSFEIAPISAVTEKEAASFVGKGADFEREWLQFGDLKCSAPVYREVRPILEQGNIDIVVDCKTKEIAPNLSFNQRSRRMVAELDGATYSLNRNR